MRELTAAVRVEVLKLKGTLALLAAFLAPLVVALLQTAMMVGRSRRMLPAGSDPYAALMNAFGFYVILMLPLFACLEATLVFGLEHTSGAWRRLGALPVRRRSIFLAKLAVLSGLVALSLALLALSVAALGRGLLAVYPDLGPASVPWALLGRRVVTLTGAALLMTVIHAWVSCRFASVPVSIGSGIAATIVGFVVASSERLVRVYPWTLPVNLLREGAAAAPFVLGSLGGTLIVALLAIRELERREIVG